MNGGCIGQWLPRQIVILKDYCSQNTIVLQSHGEMKTYSPLIIDNIE